MSKERIQFEIEAVDKASGVFNRVNASIDRLQGSVQPLSGTINKTSSAFGSLAKTFAVGSTFGLGAAAAINLVKGAFDAFLGAPVRAAAEAEQFQAQLKTFAPTAEEAKQAYEDFVQFARSTPFATPDVVEAATMLAGYGVQLSEVKDYLQTLGDAAGAMGRSITDAAYAIGAAVSGEAEPLKRWGIMMRQQGDLVTFTWYDTAGKLHKITVQNTEKMRAAVVKAIFNEKYKGGMKNLEGTWKGTMSYLKSMVWEMQVKVGQMLTQSPGIRRGLKALSGLFQALPKVFDAMAPLLQGFFNVVGDWLGAVVTGLQSFVLPLFKGLFSLLSTALAPVFKVMSEAARRFSLIMKAVAKVILKRFGPGLKKLWKVFQGIAKTVGGLLSKAFKWFLNLALTGFTWLLKLVAKLLRGLAWGQDLMAGLLKGVIGLLEKLRPLLEATQSWNPLSKAALKALDGAQGFLDDMAKNAKAAAENLRGWADGIDEVAQAIENVKNQQLDLQEVNETVKEAGKTPGSGSTGTGDTGNKGKKGPQVDPEVLRAMEAHAEGTKRVTEAWRQWHFEIQKVHADFSKVTEAMIYAEDIARKFGTTAGELVQYTKPIGDTLRNQFDALVDAAIEGRLAFKEWAQETAKAIMKVIAKMLLLKAVSMALSATPVGLGAGFLFGFNKGGPVFAFQAGGPVPGIGLKDRVPAMLTPGEFVLNRQAVQSLGRDFVQALNQGKRPAGGNVSIAVNVQGGSDAEAIARTVKDVLIDIVREEKRMGRWPS